MGNFYGKFVRTGILFAFRDGNPKNSFDEEDPPPSPNYHDDKCWGALPDLDGPHRFEVSFNIVILCQDDTVEAAVILKAVIESTIRDRRGDLQNACVGAAVVLLL